VGRGRPASRDVRRRPLAGLASSSGVASRRVALPRVASRPLQSSVIVVPSSPSSSSDFKLAQTLTRATVGRNDVSGTDGRSRSASVSGENSY